MAKQKKAFQPKGKKKKKGWFGGLGFLGSTEETKGNVTESAKQGAILVASTFAGGLAGAAIGGAFALYGGIATTLGGLFAGSDALASAGAGMMIGSAVKPTEVQNANLQQKNAEADMPIDKTRNQLATGASAFLQNMKNNSMVNKILPKAKDTTTATTTPVTTTTTSTTNTTPAATNGGTLSGIGPKRNNDVRSIAGLGNIPEYQKAFRSVGIAQNQRLYI